MPETGRVRCKDDIDMFYKSALWTLANGELPCFKMEEKLGVLGDYAQCKSLYEAIGKLQMNGLVEGRRVNINYMTSTCVYAATKEGRKVAKELSEDDKKNGYPVLYRMLAHGLKRQLKGTKDFSDISLEDCEEALRIIENEPKTEKMIS